jgi:hypothetical protein
LPYFHHNLKTKHIDAFPLSLRVSANLINRFPTSSLKEPVPWHKIGVGFFDQGVFSGIHELNDITEWDKKILKLPEKYKSEGLKTHF